MCVTMLGAIVSAVANQPLCSSSQGLDAGALGSRGHTLGEKWSRNGQPVTARHIASVMSSGDRLAEKPPLPLVPPVQASPPPPPSGSTTDVVIKVADSESLQRVEGFGGAFTHSAAQVFAEASPTVQQCLLDAYFGSHGHGYTLGRVPIGTSDFAPYHFTHAETPGDTEMKRFSVRHDQATLIPLIRAASKSISAHAGVGGRQRRGRSDQLRLVASPWSAPAWMKANNNYRCLLEPLCAGCVLKEDMLPVWAEYISRFLNAYANVTVRDCPECCV